MEPNIKSALDEVFRRLDAMETKWESKLEEVKGSHMDRDTEVDQRISVLEEAGARSSTVPVELERRWRASVSIPEQLRQAGGDRLARTFPGTGPEDAQRRRWRQRRGAAMHQH
jgi:hypothetical protein